MLPLQHVRHIMPLQHVILVRIDWLCLSPCLACSKMPCQKDFLPCQTFSVHACMLQTASWYNTSDTLLRTSRLCVADLHEACCNTRKTAELLPVCMMQPLAALTVCATKEAVLAAVMHESSCCNTALCFVLLTLHSSTWTCVMTPGIA